MKLHLQAKKPGRRARSPSRSTSTSSYAEALGPREEAYQRLLDDAMDGDARRFGREDALDEQWRIVEQVLEHHDEVHLYDPAPGARRGRCPRRRRRRLAEPDPARSRLTGVATYGSGSGTRFTMAAAMA